MSGPSAAAPPPSPAARLMRGYGPLFGFAVLFMLMAALVPTVGTEIRTETVAGSGRLGGPAGGAPAAGDGSPAGPEDALAGPTTEPGAAGGAGSAPGRSVTTASGPLAARGGTGDGWRGGPTGSGAGAAAPSRPGERPAAARPAVGGCPDRKAQVPGDPYSPPCIAFSGDNGGATSRGVTPTEIVVSARINGIPDFSSAPGETGPGAVYRFDREEVKRTLEGLAEYFNSRFQFYGRKLRFVLYDGKGSFMTEVQGGGQEQAETDAVKVADEIKPFAEIAAFTGTYSDALSRRGVVNFGSLYMSGEWLAERRPHAWSTFVDCTFLMQSVADYVNKRLAGRPARYAGGDLKGRVRTTAVIAPDNTWYQQCLDAGEKVSRAGGHPNQARIAYKLDFNTLSNQAASVIAKLKSQRITTVVCACDPAFPVFLTAKAQEQGYAPEWVVPGALSDLDVFGQMYQQDQWTRAIVLSAGGPAQPLRATLGYNAFKTARPTQEPSPYIDVLYSQLYLLAVGVQHAGPRLTPETFERGMYAYPGGSGPLGTWKFAPGRYTPQQDARELYWDPNATSVQNKQKGAYVDAQPGKRYRPGQWPAADPSIPER